MYEQIVKNNPEGAVNLLIDEGYSIPRGTTESDLASYLKQYASKHGKAALVKLSKIHPDRDLILGDYSHFDGGGCECNDCFPTKEKFSNANGGCGCGGSSKFSNASGSENPTETGEKSINMSHAIIALAMINVAAMCFITVIALKK